MPNDDGGDHEDAGLGVPPGARTVVFPSFTLERHVLHDVVVAYSTYGVFNPAGDNGVIVGHPHLKQLRARWWGEMLGSGPGFCLDVDRDLLSAPTTSISLRHILPVTPDPSKPDGRMVRRRLQPVHHPRQRQPAARLDHLGVRSLRLSTVEDGDARAEFGASTSTTARTVLVAGCGRHTDWAIGIGEAELAIMADERAGTTTRTIPRLVSRGRA